MGSGTDEKAGRGAAGAPSAGDKSIDDSTPEPLADFLAKITGVLATRIARGAYMQSMAALVAGGRSIDEAAEIAGELFDRAESDISDGELTLRRLDD